MANYKLCNSDQLDADLTTVADAIRTKGGTTEKLKFPEDYKTAIESIQTGTEVQQKTGSFSSGTVDCGFKPDMVYFTKSQSYNGNFLTGCFAFTAAEKDSINTAMWLSDGSILSCFGSRTSSGFSMSVTGYTQDWESVGNVGSFDYVAVKYT